MTPSVSAWRCLCPHHIIVQFPGVILDGSPSFKSFIFFSVQASRSLDSIIVMSLTHFLVVPAKTLAYPSRPSYIATTPTLSARRARIASFFPYICSFTRFCQPQASTWYRSLPFPAMQILPLLSFLASGIPRSHESICPVIQRGYERLVHTAHGRFLWISIEMSVVSHVRMYSLFLHVFFPPIKARAGWVQVRVGGNSQESARLVSSLPNNTMMAKDKSNVFNPTDTPALDYTPDLLDLMAHILALTGTRWYLGEH